MNFKSILSVAIEIFFYILNMLIFIRVILSWFPINRDNPFVLIIYQLTEPILGPIRALMQKSVLGGKGLMIDFSPIIALFLLEFIKNTILYYIM
ncbi:YggT family protein [Defluviitalea phaphyphila]|uniref:YggT family protein n=1 Tax=Defluviitalea phaphyphila TaxID=1473580 RepID=UPI000730B1EB|nr:YggT family protein [Defluviitalea phaphyphila]